MKQKNYYSMLYKKERKKYKCFSKRVAKRIRNLQAKFINTRLTSFWMYVSAADILVGPNTRNILRDLTKRKLFVEICLYVYHIVVFEFNSVIDIYQ